MRPTTRGVLKGFGAAALGRLSRLQTGYGFPCLCPSWMGPSQETIAGQIQALLEGGLGSRKCSSHKESWLNLTRPSCSRTQLSSSAVSGTLGLESITMVLLWGAKLRKQVSDKLAMSPGWHSPTPAQADWK